MPALRLLLRSRTGTSLNVAAMCATVQSVFDANGLDVRVTAAAPGHLDLPGMSAVSVGSCVEVLDPDHQALFKAMASTVGKRGEAAVFVVGTITDGGAASGCAAHPANCVGLVMTEAAAAAAANGGSASDGRWVLAHELGHLLDLQHDGDSASLMCDPPTAITAPMPRLSEDEKSRALNSRIFASAAMRFIQKGLSVREKTIRTTAAPKPTRRRAPKKKVARRKKRRPVQKKKKKKVTRGPK